MKKLNLFSDLWSSIVGSRKDDGSTRYRLVIVSLSSRYRVWQYSLGKIAAVVCMLLTIGIGNAWGDDQTWNLTTTSYSSISENTVTWSSTYITAVATKGTGTKVNNYCPPDNAQHRLYNNNTLTITPASGYSISSIKITATGASYRIAGTWTNGTADDPDGQKYTTITPSDGTSAVSCALSATCRLTEIKVTYAVAGAKYSLTFKEYIGGGAASGSPSTGSVMENATAFSFGATPPSKAGYVIEGFYTDTEGNSGIKVADGNRIFVANVAGWTNSSSQFTKGANTNIYIKWTPLKTFSLATSSTTLVDGDEIIITNTTPNQALSSTQNSNNRPETAVTLTGSNILVAESGPVQIIVLEQIDNKWMFNVGNELNRDQYLYAPSDANNYLRTNTKATAGDNGKWNISVNASNVATIKAQGANSYNWIQYNSSNHLFSCYKSAQQDVKIYYCSEPRIEVNPMPLNPLETYTYAEGYGPSQTQALAIKGFHLTGNLTVSCPSGYEVSTTSGTSGFGTSDVTLTRDANNHVIATVYIRLSSGKSTGNYNQTLSISGGGIPTNYITLRGSVTAVPSGTDYRLVTDRLDIFPDDEIIILNVASTHALSTTQNSNNRAAAAAAGQFSACGRDVFVTGDAVQNIEIEGCEDEWLFKVGDNNYLYAAAPNNTNNHYLRSNTLTSAYIGENAINGKWQTRINALGVHTINAPNSNNHSLIQYNYNGGTPIFSCYDDAHPQEAIKLYAKPSATPNVCGSPLELTGFEMTYGEGASAAQSFKVKGRSLTSNITVTAPTGYEVCETESGAYTAYLTLTPSDGKVTPTTLWVRLKADNEAADDVSGNITITATGATTRNIAVTGTVNPNPVITLAATDAVPLVTSRNGVNIMATKTLTLNIRGARAGQTVSISGTGLKFYRNDGHYVDLSSTALTAPVTGQVVYVSYNPTSAGTGAITTPDITVTCDGGSRTFNNLVKARNLPDAVAIVANVNGVWQALPANMSEAQNPEAVTVTVKTEGGIQKAYGPGTLAYKLWPVKTTNGAQDRFGTYTSPAALFADRVRFAGNSYAALWANDNTTTNTIRNWAAIEAVTADPAEAYEWKITTTESDGQFVYNLQTAHGTNNYYLRYWPAASGEPKWGTYANGESNLYILPLTEVADANISVMEWGTNKIAVSYPNGASCTAMTASINNASPTAVTMNSLGGDMYELTRVGDLQSNPAKTLVLTATEGGTKQAVMPIPYIISSEVAEATIRTAVGEAARLTDVIIRNGGKLTTGTGEGHFKDLYIYPGGKANVSNNLTVRNIYMRGGYSFLDRKATYLYPDLFVKSGTITTGGVKYDLYVDNRYYYTFSMPYDVALSNVHDETGSDAFNVWVKHYNGQTRASGTHVTGWEWYGDEPGQGSFFAGIGYEITAKPRVSGRPVAIIRFPVKSGNITTDAEREIGVSVGNYGYDDYSSGSLAANNVGWNFVGNPYLTEYKAGTASAENDTLMLVDQGYEKHIDETTGVWDGTYDWKASNKRFITVPYDTQTDYHSEFVATYTIPAFSAFFIQTTETGTFYMRGSRPQAAVAPRFGQAPKEKPELHIDVLLSGEGESVEGKAGLLIHDKYEGGLKDFEDVEQWFVEQNELKTYTFANGVALAYNLTDEQTVQQPIPMGYIATEAGEHIYSINETNDVRELEHLWLTDNETGITTDLLARDYTFTTEAGRFDERFTLSAIFKQQEVVTDIVDVGDDDWIQSIGVYNEANTLTLRGLPENSAVYIFDMTGKLVAGGDRLHNVATFNIAAQGVYNIRVVDGERAVTLRSVIR